MPLARMAMYNKGVEIYLAPTADSRDSWNATMQHIAFEGRCYVIGCNQYFTKSDFPQHLQTELAQLYGEEGILTAEVDLDELVRSRMDFDVTGHYSRNDIFKLKVKNQPEIKSI